MFAKQTQLDTSELAPGSFIKNVLITFNENLGEWFNKRNIDI